MNTAYKKSQFKIIRQLKKNTDLKNKTTFQKEIAFKI